MLKVGNPTPSQKASPRRNPRMRNNTCGTHLCQHDLSTNSDQESVKQNVSKKKLKHTGRYPYCCMSNFTLLVIKLSLTRLHSPAIFTIQRSRSDLCSGGAPVARGALAVG